MGRDSNQWNKENTASDKHQLYWPYFFLLYSLNKKSNRCEISMIEN